MIPPVHAPVIIRAGRRRGRTASVAGLAFLLAALVVLVGAVSAQADELAYVCETDICTIDAIHPETHADLTETSSNDDTEPAWSPDGTKIAFSGDYPPDYGDVYVTSPTIPGVGTDISNSANISDAQAAWSADGKQLAWEAANVTTADIYIDFAAADGTTTPQSILATPEGGHVQDRAPAWSPLAATFAFARHTSIFVATPAASLTAHFLSNGLGVSPAWSPDGFRIAAISENEPHKVRLIDAAGSGIATELPIGAEHGSSVAWSPDATHVTYIDESDQVRVAPTNPVGAGFTITLPPGVIVPHDPSFSPDGTQLVFSARNSNQHPEYERLYLAPATGGEATQLTMAPGNAREPVWKPEPGASAPSGGSGSGPGGSSTGGSASGSPGSGTGSAGGAPKAPVTIKFASYRHPLVYAGFLGAASVDCALGSTNAACQVSGEATYVAPITNSRDYARKAGPKPVVFAKGSVKVPHGKTVPLRLKVTAAGSKLLKPGRPLKLALTITETAPGAAPQKATKVITVKAKGAKK